MHLYPFVQEKFRFSKIMLIMCKWPFLNSFIVKKTGQIKLKHFKFVVYFEFAGIKLNVKTSRLFEVNIISILEASKIQVNYELFKI